MSKTEIKQRYGVYTAEGVLLSVWPTRAQALRFVPPGLGREVRPIGSNALLPTVTGEQYRRDKLERAGAEPSAHSDAATSTSQSKPQTPPDRPGKE